MSTQTTTLFSLDVVKTWLGVTLTDTSKDGIIAQIADGVSQRIESACHRPFVTRSFTETYNGDGTTQLLLRHWPVVAVSSFTMKDTQDGTPVAYVNGTDYDLDRAIGALRLRSIALWRGFQNIAVTYTAGWGAQDAASLPQDVYQAGLDYVKAVYSEWDAGAIAASSVSIGPNAMVIKPGLPYGIKGVLDQWKARRL